ncbi:hypothetical protein TNCV_3608181 [Trichonephila clavipes]|nr:hypothetical protein TNCV_3608181 [Trichonephila clavipes]
MVASVFGSIGLNAYWQRAFIIILLDLHLKTSGLCLRSDWHDPQTPIATVDELWYRVEAAWASVPVHAIQSQFDSMPRRISAVIIARVGCFWY